MTEIETYVPKSLAQVEPRPDFDSWIAVVGEVAKLAGYIADTEFVPQALRGNAPAVAAAILAGRETGVPPMQSLQNINVIKGKPAPSALLMRQLALAAGHEIRYLDTTDTRCVVEGRRRGGGAHDWERVQFTSDQAKRAHIDLGGYPEDKLVARATSRLCRRLFADAIGGMPYSVEELEDGVDPEVIDAAPALTAPAEVDPPKRTAQRRTTPKTRPAAADPIPPPPAGPTSPDAANLPPLPGEPGYDDEPANMPADVPAAEPEPDVITAPQLKHLKTLLTSHGLDRDRGLTVYEEVTGRRVNSTKDLTRREASLVIDTLIRLEVVAGEDLALLLARIAEINQPGFEFGEEPE